MARFASLLARSMNECCLNTEREKQRKWDFLLGNGKPGLVFKIWGFVFLCVSLCFVKIPLESVSGGWWVRADDNMVARNVYYNIII